MAGSITVKDVARAADVSIGTVSRVFNNHINVTEETRQRVLKAATDLGYFGISLSGQDGRSRDSFGTLKEIGFLFCSPIAGDAVSPNPFWSHILYGVENEARKSNMKVTYCSISELAQTPQLLQTTIYDMKLGGILLVGPTDKELVSLIQNMNLPLVLIDNYLPELQVDAVLSDNFEGAKTAVGYLIEQGHRRIAFIGGPSVQEGNPRPVNRIYSFEQRARGYRSALFDANLPINDSLYEAGTVDTDGGYEACQRLLAREQFTALFCANDATALGALKALREAGKRVPEEVSLVGYDDLDMVEHLMPPLTTVRVQKEAIGSTAVKQLLLRATNMDTPRVRCILDVELMKRASVQALPS